MDYEVRLHGLWLRQLRGEDLTLPADSPISDDQFAAGVEALEQGRLDEFMQELMDSIAEDTEAHE